VKSIEHSLEIKGSASDVYSAWTDFEHFPRFMPSILEVQRLDENHLRWTAEFAGQRMQWESAISVLIPNRRVAWRVVGEESGSGATTMEEIEPGRTRLTLQMTYTPAAPWGAIDEGSMKEAIVADLARFKLLFEGARRGQA
jgi:uncharacterized membrane protein